MDADGTVWDGMVEFVTVGDREFIVSEVLMESDSELVKDADALLLDTSNVEEFVGDAIHERLTVGDAVALCSRDGV